MFDTLKYLNLMILGLNDKRKSEQGATATEYGLLVAFIAIAIILMVTAFGGALGTFFQAMADEVATWDDLL